jgi:hypothetical protein
VVKLAAHRAQAGLNIAQAFAIGKLREGHGEELFPATEFLGVPVAAVASHASLKLFVGQILDQLRKHRAARVHAAFSQPQRVLRKLPAPSA